MGRILFPDGVTREERLEAAERVIRHYGHVAGRAVRDYEGVNSDLSDAVDVFAAGDWSNLSVSEIATAGHRIARLATMLRDADSLRSVEAFRDQVRAEEEE